ncbi:hypothetical protein IF650_17005 [Cellulosimicrobium terreum]|nr:hypothetical protein [Cellulosimicrobium terreum]
MSDNGSNMQPVRPLTRREIREREQAAAAQRAAQSAGAGAPAQPAAAPAGPPPSRRSMRETTGPADQPAQPSVVRPPSMSGGMRGLDETGRLTPVQETAERVMVRPPATPTPPPARTGSRPAPSVVTRAPGASGPVRPPTPVRGATGAGAVPVARVSARTPQEPAAPAQPQSQPQRLSAFSAPPTSGSTTPRSPGTPAPAPATSPWSSGPTAATARSAAPERPTVSPEPPQETSVAALPWSAITSGGAPERATVPAATAPDDLFPRVHAARDGAGPDADEDEAEDVRGPSYTWLHYLILVAVAFVLGLLVWKLISSDAPAPSSAAAVVVVGPGAVAPTDPPGVVR